jgi:hypothetical protein
VKRLVLSILLIFSICSVVSLTAHAQGSEKQFSVVCKECGVINSEDGLFCAGCGSKLTRPLNPVSPRKSLNDYHDIFNFDSKKKPALIKSKDNTEVDPIEAI